MEKQCIFGQHTALIELSQLDDRPGPYAMSFGYDLGPLCASIREIGLVHPPCIAFDGEGRTELVTGYRRVLALKRLGWRKVGCENVSGILPTPLQRLDFALHENRVSRDFNPVEKAMVLQRLDPLLEKRDLLDRFMPLLGLPSHEGLLTFYLKLAKMKGEYLDALAGGRLSLNAARLLLDVDPDSADCAFQILSGFALNFNQQLQFIDLLIDISKIERKSFSQVLLSEPLQALFDKGPLNTPQRAKKLLEGLRAMRYPRWQKAEKRFREKLDRIPLPDGARIDHPAYFEAPGYRLEVRFQDGPDLMEKLGRLVRSNTLQDLQDPTGRDG